jgi:hypothetical protein
MATVVPQWLLRRLASRFVRIVKRRAPQSPVIEAFLQLAVPKAGQYITVYNKCMKFDANWKREMADGRGAIVVLFKQILSWAPLVKRDAPGFDTVAAAMAGSGAQSSPQSLRKRPLSGTFSGTPLGCRFCVGGVAHPIRGGRAQWVAVRPLTCRRGLRRIRVCLAVIHAGGRCAHAGVMVGDPGATTVGAGRPANRTGAPTLVVGCGSLTMADGGAGCLGAPWGCKGQGAPDEWSRVCVALGHGLLKHRHGVLGQRVWLSARAGAPRTVNGHGPPSCGHEVSSRGNRGGRVPLEL